jgi:RNA polymerase sigma-70 factor (ECF subfamily)
MNDTELIEGCKAGKREALETIYRLFSRQMYGVCYRYVGEDSALDVMHDGFVKVFSASYMPPTCMDSDPGSPVSW